MITVLVIFSTLLLLSFMVAVITGLIAISPLVLLVICLPIIDYFFIKIIFGKKKK